MTFKHERRDGAPDVALITCAEWPAMTSEGQLLIAELKALGLNAQPLVWDDPAVNWSVPKVCVIRETWDYHHRRDEFVAWVERVGSQTTLLNSADMVRWNTHKGYLRSLEERGVPIVPTAWLAAESEIDLRHIMSSNRWKEVVIKPAISASAFETIQVGLAQITEGQAHINRLLPSHDLMVQPFIASVRDYGERSLMFIDGQLTHTVRRTPALHPEEGADAWQATLVQPTPEEAEMAAHALQAAGYPALYARVDIVRDEANVLRLMELELVEPSLFLTLAPEAARRLAEAIARYAKHAS